MTQSAESLQITHDDFAYVAEMVRQTAGIVVREGKMAMVRGRLGRRARSLNLDSIAAYCDVLRKDKSELQGLINALTTNHTAFFREMHHFEFLENSVLPALIASRQPRIRFWSSACSSGEEPYSLAAIAQKFRKELSGADFRILATDIDTEIVEKAETGVYSQEAVAGLSEPLLALLDMQKVQQHWSIGPRLRERISFRHLNLLESWPFSGKFDVIFCRNVMIYFDPATKTKLIDRFIDQLHAGGYLIIGHSESLSGQHDRLELIGRTIYRKI